ncbi:3-ketoacyl-ACP reductase [Flavihumibacter stibioxidans]|uniref:3-ketoacyl-ACP reductase n=2 Tax=Flavihumibacter stibioxidans TaxID=1834163 RepID=A0ABR7M5R2_9BACT|nr:3-ketoacyl-ACP reductase [Flavihumibacter stibioxidans]
MKKLDNKVALVTGAGSGLGKAISLLFAAEGARLVASDINETSLAALKEEVSGNGGTITTVVANMAKAEDIENMISLAVKEYGTLDIVVNNAGIMDNFSPVAEVDDQVWQRLMDVNLTGPFKAMRASLKIMLAKQSGVIVNIASIGGLQGARAGAAYTASKHALIGLTKNTGYMYAKSGIRCNAIAPGAMETNIGSTIDYSKVTPLINERIMTGLSLNPRSSNPSEVASVALFLASDDASFINGTTVVADGGWTAF